MAKSDLLRFHDIRDAYRLIEDCRDLGSDPALWHRRMLEGLCPLIGVPAAVAGEGYWVEQHRVLKAVAVFDYGFDSHGHERLMAYHRDLGLEADPIFIALRRASGRLITRTRRQIVADTEWYGSAVFNDYHRPAGVDHQLTSIYQPSDDGGVSVIALHRGLKDGDFSPRQQRLLEFFHGELGRLIRRSLASHAEPNPVKLSPRLRQTLACLAEGDSEKQVALRLGISQATTHQYVTALYRRFNVRSRAQLLATLMRRGGWVLSLAPASRDVSR